MDRVNLESKLLKELGLIWEQFTIKLPKNYKVAEALSALSEYEINNSEPFVQGADSLFSTSRFTTGTELEGGMNSPGILWDRLTILLCKKFFTAPNSPHFNSQLHTKNVDIDSELDSVLKALHTAKPAKNILLAKEATERQSEASSIGAALWELQGSNLAMWINQDLLYTVNVDEVDSNRLREYIKFFSIANKTRNTAIEHLELIYTQKILKEG
ncbi:MAG: hypothetical protein PHN84_10320 [Desulfuromonadaceae bacterium]|nr:hypothetical protein [Desulfuromonadaceae bacterium]MDD2854568.1 hypothetical protein [Desulfuromonadaceae bacterium]